MSKKPLFVIAWMILASLVSFGQGELERTVRYDAASGFTIITDTIGIDLSSLSTPVSNMELEFVMDYRGNNLYFFDARNYTAFNNFDYRDKYHLVSVSPGNERQTIIEIPPKTRFGWLSYFLCSKNNQLYLWYSRESKNKKPDLCWDDNSQRWIETDIFSTTCYEDEDFAVSFEPQGEWGLFTCFHDKQTGLKHLFDADMDKIVRYHDTYYIISKAVIYEVKDPRKGWVMDNTPYDKWGYHTPKAKTFISSKYKSYWDYEYYMGDDQSPDTLYFTGFIHDDNFYVLAGNTDELFLAQVRPTGQPKFQKVLTLEKIGHDLPFSPYMSNNWNPYRSLCMFHGNCNSDVILDMKSDTIHFTYLRTNPDTLQYLGPAVWPKMMDYLTDNIGKVTMDDVAQFEKQVGGKAGKGIKESSMNHCFPQSGDSLYELITYYHAIDENDSFEVEYCRHKESNVAAAVFIEFEQTRYYHVENRFFDESRTITEETLSEFMEQYLASPPDSINMDNTVYPRKYWHRNEHTYFLVGDRITIY
ncbi:MAG: hypothetical protein IKX59_09915 [Bacteroidales bacterium]|nr:hypothetical protein [Bacteroidales bacterium]